MDMLNDIFALYLIDQAEIMIKGEEEVLCGDETHFEATVKGTEASEYTITWQKRKGLLQRELIQIKRNTAKVPVKKWSYNPCVRMMKENTRPSLQRRLMEMISKFPVIKSGYMLWEVRFWKKYHFH